MNQVIYMKNIWSGESWLMSNTSAPSFYSESKTFLFLKTYCLQNKCQYDLLFSAV